MDWQFINCMGIFFPFAITPFADIRHVFQMFTLSKNLVLQTITDQLSEYGSTTLIKVGP